MKTKNAMTRACEIVGSQRKMAQILGVSPTAVSYWCRGETVPSGRCKQIELATNGQVTRQQLRPLDWQTFWGD